ncbi:NAD-binding protein [Pedobacter psychrophilus]|uniref:NAD-binding protein n=1 Tax=Pedobacter psychrophilus TaxID=1826909 RepID=A0A179DFT7_9SPHI|nr:Gfo/Idh/MocA family oxidoreductase [Pedobacter psychrophilus]OAQ39818.1 NAD-binding protein [Pedobacter psychrophilus]
MDKKKFNWGILSTAKIGRKNVVPALKRADNCEVVAIASRNKENAEETAQDLGIKKSYGSYEELFLDKDIDVIYNPLPNNLHLEYTLKALEHGKHVLCEKPIGLNAKEVALLNEELKKHPDLKVMEAFMYKFHPQWIKAKEIIKNGDIGEIISINTLFSYYNKDGQNIRNQTDAGGGALMDIGCYCISFPRFILEAEPLSVFGSVQKDPVFKTDFLTSGILHFDKQVVATFSCSTQAYPYQRCHIIGNKGRIEIEFPCNAPTDAECKIILNNAEGKNEFVFKANQYQLQCKAFADAILTGSEVPYSLNDAENNMKVIDAIIQSAASESLIKIV